MKSTKESPPRFEYLVLGEKNKLAKIYGLVKGTIEYYPSDMEILKLKDLNQLRILLKDREFGNLKAFYNFLCSNDLHGLALVKINNREQTQHYPYPLVLQQGVSYE